MENRAHPRLPRRHVFHGELTKAMLFERSREDISESPQLEFMRKLRQEANRPLGSPLTPQRQRLLNKLKGEFLFERKVAAKVLLHFYTTPDVKSLFTPYVNFLFEKELTHVATHGPRVKPKMWVTRHEEYRRLTPAEIRKYTAFGLDVPDGPRNGYHCFSRHFHSLPLAKKKQYCVSSDERSLQRLYLQTVSRAWQTLTDEQRRAFNFPFSKSMHEVSARSKTWVAYIAHFKRHPEFKQHLRNGRFPIAILVDLRKKYMAMTPEEKHSFETAPVTSKFPLVSDEGKGTDEGSSGVSQVAAVLDSAGPRVLYPVAKASFPN
jgi:hypothetical protein